MQEYYLVGGYDSSQHKGKKINIPTFKLCFK